MRGQNQKLSQERLAGPDQAQVLGRLWLQPHKERSKAGLPANISFKPSPLRGLGPTDSQRAGRLNSGVRFDMKFSCSALLAFFAALIPVSAYAENLMQEVQVVGVAGADASAVIRVCADKQGRPYDITMIQSSGDKKMDRAVFQAAKRWKFPRIRKDGTERPECEDVPVSMKID